MTYAKRVRSPAWVAPLFSLVFGLALFSFTPLARADGSALVPPKLAGAATAEYPEGAAGHAEVQLELLVTETGAVGDVRVRSGEEPFTTAAVRAARDFQFEPAARDGLAVRARILFLVVFDPPSVSPAAPTAEPEVEPGAAPPPAAPSVVGTSAAPAASTAGVAAPEVTTTEIVVLGDQRPELGSIPLPREEARRIPGAFGDPFRVVEILPGVAPVLSGLPYFFVHASAPGTVGYFIDGIRIPLLFHVGSGPSVMAPMFVERVNLFAGAAAPRYGGFTGAVFTGDTTSPRDHAHTEITARIFDASAATEQPFADGRGNVAIGGRIGYTQALLSLVAPDYQLGYGDYQARISYQLTRQDRLTLFGFGAYDRLHNKAEQQTPFDVDFQRVDLRWDRTWATGKSRIGFTFSRDSVATSQDRPGAETTTFHLLGGRFHAEFEQRVLPSVTLHGGGEVNVDTLRSDYELWPDGLHHYPDHIDRGAAAYLDARYRPSRRVELDPGVRVQFARSRGRVYHFVEPRLLTRTVLANGLAHLSGFGIAHQLPANSTRMPGWVPDDTERRATEAVQLNQGLEYALPLSLLGRTNFFHQRMGLEGTPNHGRSYGVEQFLHRNFSETFGVILSYTLSRSEAELRDRTLLTNYDRTHVLSLVLGYDFGSGFRLGARGYWSSGRKYTTACPNPTCAAGDVPLMSVPNQMSATAGEAAQRPRPAYLHSGRTPPFSRLDLRFEKRWDLSGGAWLTATFEWFNALLTTEAQYAYYTPDGLKFYRQSALTLPSIGLEFGY